MFWEVMKPGAGGKDFELWINESIWNDVIKPKTKNTNSKLSGWSWPEIWPGDKS